LLAYLAINIIWLSLMVTPILCGLFLCALNLTLFPLCQKNSLMSSHSLTTLSKSSSATMVVSLIMPPLAHSLSPKGYFYRCLVHTFLHRMVKPSTYFTPSIICYIPCFFQTSIPARYRVEGLHTATYMLNRLPTKAINMTSSYSTLHGVTPSYEHLHVFGCACYLISSSKPLTNWHPGPPDVFNFLEYSADHKGYRCLDLTATNFVVS
jgi:hypothetical protein